MKRAQPHFKMYKDVHIWKLKATLVMELYLSRGLKIPDTFQCTTYNGPCSKHILAKQLIWTQKQNMKHHLGLKKGKTRRIKIPAKFSFFLPLSLIHSWISTPWLSRIPLLPQIRDGNKCWCSLLTVSTRGKELPEGTHCGGAPLAWHTAGLGGMRNAKSRPWGLLMAGDPSCHTIAYSHRTDRDKARG